jgi:hypothetical protein
MNTMMKRFTFSSIFVFALLSSCSAQKAPNNLMTGDPLLQPVTTKVRAVDAASECTGAFKKYTLNFETTTVDGKVMGFDSNGAGVAAGDLDDDGDIDLVFANLADPAAILWNEGRLQFRKQVLDYRDLRAVAIVDVDSDSKRDIVFTQRFAAPLFLRNDGKTFTRVNLSNVFEPAYSMAWADLDGDLDLDLVTASYNAELMKNNPNHFLFNKPGGVMVYTNLGAAKFKAQRLEHEAFGLALLVSDLDGDARPDIWIGNDFDPHDSVWLNTNDGWQRKNIFSITSHSTMSLSKADMDNDGTDELFSADMKPYDTEVGTWVEWLPVMQSMRKSIPRGDPQQNENMFMRLGADGKWRNDAITSGVDAAGWAWSAQFGDLDQDGFLDLYVVNGMIDNDFFRHLKNKELVEENQAFRNNEGRAFGRSPQWNLNAKESGRGMVMADFDNDGDLDIAVNNLRAPATLFENKICGGASLQVELNDASAKNLFAVGARLELKTSEGSYFRELNATSAHLSGDSPRAHFGFPKQAVIEKLIVRWADGARSEVSAPKPNTILEVTR